MTIRGEKIIEFDFPFNYSQGGEDKVGTFITVKAPSLKDMRIHSEVTSTVTKALFKAMPLMESAASARKKMIASDKNNELENTPENKTDKTTDEERGEEALQFLSIGMESDKYSNFTDYLKNILTKNDRLASIEDTNIPLSDYFWEQISSEGGLLEINKVLGVFVSFFIDEGIAKKKKAAE